MSDYWNNFYKENFEFENKPSTFCNFVLNYLKNFNNHKKLIDIGFGNGRDIIKFSEEGYECTGIDISEETLKSLRKKQPYIKLINDDFVNHNYDNYDIYYSRFTLHAIKHNEILQFIKNISNSMNENSILFIETRSIKMTKYNGLEYKESTFKSGIGDFHKRTLLSKEYLRRILNDNNLFVDFEIEDRNLSPYRGEDPFLIRMVVSKIEVKRKLRTLIDKTQKRQFYLRKIVDDIIEIFEKNNIEWGIFFGNLIGLLRHKDVFVPWDDDVDFVVNECDLEKIETIIRKKFDVKEVVKSETTMVFQLKENSIWIDFFFDVNKFCKIDEEINLSKYNSLGKYKYPVNFKPYFEKFYGQEINDILKTCVIYNHEYNNRWTQSNEKKFRIETNKCRKLLEEISLDISKETLEYKVYKKEESNKSFIIDTSKFLNLEELCNIINTIESYKNIYIKVDEFFNYKYKLKDLPELRIFLYRENIEKDINTKIIETNQIENLILKSINVNNEQVIVDSNLPNIIDFIFYNFNGVLFGLTLILLKLNKKTPILQFLIIDKKIDFEKAKKLFEIIGSTENWIKFKYDEYYVIEIFEYKSMEDELIVQERVYKGLPLYDNLKNNQSIIILNHQNSILTNDYVIAKNLEIKDSDIDDFCKK